MAQNVEVGLTSRAEETLCQRNKWRQQFDRGTLMACILFSFAEYVISTEYSNVVMNMTFIWPNTI